MEGYIEEAVRFKTSRLDNAIYRFSSKMYRAVRAGKGDFGRFA